MNVESLPFGEVVSFEKKTKRRASEGLPEGEYPFFTSSQVQSRFLNNHDFNGEYLILGSGGNPSLHYYNGNFSTSADCFIVKSAKRNILIKYVYYYLLGNLYLLEEGFKGSGLKHISKEYLKNITIVIPPIELQKEIILIFDKIIKLKERADTNLHFLDKCLESIFYNMFGNINSNSKGFRKMTLPMIVKKDKYSIKRGPFGGSLKKDIFVDKGYLVYEQRHAIHNDFNYEKYFITKEKYDELKMFKVLPGDLIVSCSGVTLGKIAEIPLKAKPGIINQALLKITLDKTKVNNEFFKFLFRTKEIQEILFDISRGSGIPNLPSISHIKKIEFPIPPLELQKEFEIVVGRIQEIKIRYLSNQTQYSYLFNSLFKKYLNFEDKLINRR